MRIKVRAIENKRYMRLDPAGQAWGFFGWCVSSHTSLPELFDVVNRIVSCILRSGVHRMALWLFVGGL